jgi:hypothetical protein
LPAKVSIKASKTTGDLIAIAAPFEFLSEFGGR